MQVAQTFAKNRLGKRLLMDEKFYTAQKGKKIHAQWRGSFLSLPLTVGLLLTVKNQIVHIRHAVVQHHAVCLLSCKSEHSIPQMFGIFNKKNIMNL